MLTSVAGEQRYVLLTTAHFVVNRSDGDASLGRWKCEIGDLHLLLHFVEEILDGPFLRRRQSGCGGLILRRRQLEQYPAQKKRFHHPRGAITRSITLIDFKRSGSTTA